MGTINLLAKTITETSAKASWRADAGNMELLSSGRVSLQSRKQVAYRPYQSRQTKETTQNCQLPLLLAEHRTHRRGQVLEQAGNRWVTANDMLYGDMTTQQLNAIHLWFRANTGQSDEVLFAVMRSMAADFFSTGQLEGVAMQMIDKFQRKEGGSFSNPILTRAVRDHASTQRFSNEIRTQIMGGLRRCQGDPCQLRPNEDVSPTGVPRFNTNRDTFLGGLTFLINDVWAYKVELTEYNQRRAGNVTFYSGSYRITLYDHFGLDLPDVEKKYVYLGGFRAWFILQHHNTRAYKPFVTEVVLDFPFSGNTTLGRTRTEREGDARREAAAREEQRRRDERLRQMTRRRPGEY